MEGEHHKNKKIGYDISTGDYSKVLIVSQEGETQVKHRISSMGFVHPASSFRIIVIAVFINLAAVTLVRANGTVDHGKALIEWLRSTEGGFFHPHLELRRQGDTPFYGMYANQTIAKNDVMMRIPRELLVTPVEDLRVGDRIYSLMDEEQTHGTIVAITEDDTFQIILDNGDVLEAEEDEFELISDACKTVQFLVDEMQLGNESTLAPYLDYLKSQPHGQLPCAWSQAGKDLYLEILGDLPGEPEILPPSFPLFQLDEFNTNCKRHDPFEEHLYLLMLQRGWDEVMIPVFDMMSHGNGRLLNTISETVHDEEEPVVVRASRDIQAGEEIYTTYNFCPDCDARYLTYGTPELLRDYGFVERFPQRWVFPEQNTIFDLDRVYDEDGFPTSKLELTWVEGYELEHDHVGFFKEQLIRLEDLGETAFASKDPSIPDPEWEVLVQFREAYIYAIKIALAVVEHEAVQECDGGSCIVASTRYGAFQTDEWELWNKYRPETCDDMKFMTKLWTETESIDTLYQRIVYLNNPTYDPPDTCFMLDGVWQICTSYRPHYHEMVVHFTARFIDEVKRVLFVGGGDSMLLHDILKYPILEKVVGLEIDQQVTRGAFKHFGAQPHFDNEKVEWWYGDAAKSMLMIPKEYYGSFDMVLVDLSETVVSLSVTDELDVMAALSLLLQPDGVLVKNEYNYFPQHREVFKHALHVHYYNVHSVCSQSLMLGSHSVDFARGKYNVHDVHHIYNLLDEPNVRYEVSRDYQLNHTNPQHYCINSEHYMKEYAEQQQSPGVTMIVEAEQSSRILESSEALRNTVVQTMTEQEFSVVSSVISEAAKQPLVVTILQEGYVVGRAWPDEKYYAFDIHLWSRFDKHNVAKKALITAVGSNVDGPSSSSYRIVSGGMFGISTWKEDQMNRGPKLPECSNNTGTTDDDAKSAYWSAPVQSDVLTSIEESMNILVRHVDSEFVVAVLCGPQEVPCAAVESVKKTGRIAHVIPLHTCTNLVGAAGFAEDAIARMLSCDKQTWKWLQQEVSVHGKIRAIVVDDSAEFPYMSIVQSIFKSRVNKNLFLTENMTVVAPIASKDERWRMAFVDSFRKSIFPEEPSYKSEIYVNSTSSTSDTFFVMSLFSSGDALFFEHLVEYVDQVENRTGRLAEINNVRGGQFQFQDPFESKQRFVDADFDQETQLKQWTSQKPLGIQALFQFELAKSESKSGSEVILSPTRLKGALEQALSSTVGAPAVVEEFTGIGDGSIAVSIWSSGNAVLLWDGRKHVDLNLFLYDEDFDLLDRCQEALLKELPELKLVLCDVQPRGSGRVVNFAKDLELNKKPLWM